MAVLRRDTRAPADLRDRALFLAGRVLEFDPALRGGAGLLPGGPSCSTRAQLWQQWKV